MSSTPSALGRPAGSNSEETRQRIIAATMRCVAEVGYSRATMRDIASGAQMTGGSLYHYFPNKSELVKATFLELAAISVPRLVGAADGADGVLDKLMAVLDCSDQMMLDYPYAASFDRALRLDSPEDLQLVEDSDTIFTALHDVVVDIVEQARHEGALGAEADVESASDAIYVLIRGLNEHAAVASSDRYHATVRALKLLIRGALFNQSKLV